MQRLLCNYCYVLHKCVYKFFLKICPQLQKLVSGELDRTVKRNTLKWMIKVTSCKCMSVVSVKLALFFFSPPESSFLPESKFFWNISSKYLDLISEDNLGMNVYRLGEYQQMMTMFTFSPTPDI